MSDILNRGRDLPEIEIRGGKKFAQAYLGMCAQIEDPKYKGVYFIPLKRKNETYKYIYLKEYFHDPNDGNKIRYKVDFVDENFNVVKSEGYFRTSRLRTYLGIKEKIEDRQARLKGLK